MSDLWSCAVCGQPFDERTRKVMRPDRGIADMHCARCGYVTAVGGAAALARDLATLISRSPDEHRVLPAPWEEER